MVSNLVNGIDQYILPTMERVRTFSHTIHRNVPLHVATAQENSWVLSGGDDGFARVFDLRTGELLEKVAHGLGTYYSRMLF